MNSIGERIKYLRGKANLTQAELAVKIGVINETICAWEHNSVKITKPKMQKLTELFNVSDYWLTHGMQLPVIDGKHHRKSKFKFPADDKFLLKRKTDGVYKSASGWSSHISEARKFTKPHAILYNNCCGNHYEIIPEKKK